MSARQVRDLESNRSSTVTHEIQEATHMNLESSHMTPQSIDNTSTLGADASLSERIAALDWENIENSLNADGFAVTPTLLSPAECNELGRQ